MSKRLPRPPSELTRFGRIAVHRDANLAATGAGVVGFGNLLAGIGLATNGHPWAAIVDGLAGAVVLAAALVTPVVRRRSTVVVPPYVRGARRGQPQSAAPTSPAWYWLSGLRGPLREVGEDVYAAMLRACAPYLANEDDLELGAAVLERLERLQALFDEQRRQDAQAAVAGPEDRSDLDRADQYLGALHDTPSIGRSA